MNVFNGKPEEILTVEPKIANPLLRVAAVLLDGLILLPAGILIVILSNPSPKLTFLMFPIFLLLYTLYQAYFHYKFGANLVKMALKMKVVNDADHSRIDFNTTLKRISVEAVLRGALAILLVETFLSLKNTPAFSNVAELTKAIQASPYPMQTGKLITLNGGWDYLSFMICLFSHKRKALHDFIAGTVVIRER